jgi:malto-oligosyltrehalose trehalohydrolase
MPLAESPGARGWGYDGVYAFAPEARYGRPDALKALVDAAHARGLMVVVDVVYNHFGPEGNYLGAYAPVFTERHHTPWGAAIDFEGARPVREFFVHNALYWLVEYHVDGLRLDAVHAIRDDSTPDVLVELAETVHRTVRDRAVHLVVENDANDARYLVRDGGRPRWYAAQWNDDLHHALHVVATGEREGYYADYADAPVARLGRALAEGFVYQGEPSAHRDGAPRGEPSAHLPPTAFVAFAQNHDQIGNRAFGERLAALVPPAVLHAVATILLVSPQLPLLFMGEEWGCTQPFPFFCDFGPGLAAAVRDGRRQEFARFSAFADPVARARIPDPGAPDTFARAVLRWEDAEKPPHAEWRARYGELLALRRREIVPRLAAMRGGDASFETVGAHGLRVVWRLGDGAALTLLANLGPDATTTQRPRGRLLYTTAVGALDGGALPAWGVAWLLDEHPA